MKTPCVRDAFVAFLRAGSVVRIPRRFARAASWAVADQVLFASGNLVASLLLARWLSVDSFGAFGLAYSVLALLGGVQSAVLTEPMLVFGAGRYASRQADYFGAVLLAYALLAGAGVVAALLGGVAAMSLLGGMASPTFIVVTLSAPFALLFWLARRIGYVVSRPAASTVSSAVYLSANVGGLSALELSGLLTVHTALLTLALASVAATAVMVLLLGIRSSRPSAALMWRSARDHLGYAKWSVGTAVLAWVPGNALYLLLASAGGLTAVGELRALVNFTVPIAQVNAALSTLALPQLASRRTGGGFWRRVHLLLIGMLTLSVLFYLFLLVLGADLVHWVYGGAYSQVEGLLAVLGLSAVFSAIAGALGTAARAAERPDLAFWSLLVSAITTVTVGAGLVFGFGVSGAAVANVVSVAVSALVLSVACVPLARTGNQVIR